MIYAVRHVTAYGYAEPVDLSCHALRLTPRTLPHQQVIEAAVATRPAAARQTQSVDAFGNAVTYVAIEAPHRELIVESTATVDVEFPPPPAAALTPAWESVRDLLQGDGFPELVDISEFVHDSPLVESALGAALADGLFAPGRPLLEAALALNRRVNEGFAFDPTATAVSTPLADVVRLRRGVCQDFAHAMIAALRSVGLAARYVSGYVRNVRGDGAALAGADASHAWVSVYCPGAGWIDLDPTNARVVSDEHVVVGWGRDYADVSPIRGVILGGGAHRLAVEVRLEPA
jgi:transglutaminase-like putative cysteine protease